MSLEVFFKDLVDNGAAIAFLNGKKILAYGALPQEMAKVKIVGKKGEFLMAKVEEVVNASKWRIKPKEDHFLSCAPWQIFDYEFQVENKKRFLGNAFSFLGKDFHLDGFFTGEKIFEYREKMEFSFVGENSAVYLAFYERGNSRQKVKLKEGCVLMKPPAKELALYLIKEMNKQKIQVEALKSLIIRTTSFGNLIFVLLFKEENCNFNFKAKIDINGYIIAYSSGLSPASIIQKILKKEGDLLLKEKIKSKLFYYTYDSFFQNNLEMFSLTLDVMRKNIFSPIKKLVDFYSGVGVIGLSLSDLAEKVVCVESNVAASQLSARNAVINDASNVRAINALSEKVALDILADADLVIFDPPRTGLHSKMLKALIRNQPQLIFYLSCNPFSQARDIFVLKDYYQVEKIYGFDFYPQTPHLESLIILKKI
jgi:23S rRNA (uracil1939-C5)-methyltransferase